MKGPASLKIRMRAGAVALAIVLGTTVSACGDDDDGVAEANDTFVSEYETVTIAFEERTETIKDGGRAALGAGDAAVLAVYRDLLAASEEAHDAYQDIDPVPDLRPAFENLVDQLERQAEVLAAVVEASEGGDDSQLALQLQELATVVVEVTNARRTVDRQIEGLAGAPTDE